MAVTVGVVDTTHRRPVLSLDAGDGVDVQATFLVTLDPQTHTGVAAQLAGVRVVPLVGYQTSRWMRSINQRVVVSRPVARLHHSGFFDDRQHGVAEAVQLGEVLRFGGLDHEGPSYREAHRRGVESVVDEALGDVVDGDPCLGSQRT